jgi:hypothetical protein
VDCPKCGYLQADGPECCARCGIVFARFRPPLTAAEAALPLPGRVVRPAFEERPPVSTRALAIAAGAGALGVAVPFLRFFGSFLSTLVHEFGHTVAAWAFGYPSVPAFDFVYGGGVTIHDERNTGLLIVTGAAFAFACWSFRRRSRVLAGLGALGAVYVLLAATPAHEFVIVAAGHGSELLLAGVFIYRGLTGVACRIEAERPCYVGAGTFIALHAARFGWQLANSEEFRALYEDAKGGGGWMDLSRIATEFWPGTSVAALGGWFALLALATPLAALAAARLFPAAD